jgi:hypothetical protein
VKKKIAVRGLRVKTGVKAGGTSLNHNETLVRDLAKVRGMRVKTRGVRAGALAANHNETLVRECANGMRVKTGVKAGMLSANHNETFVCEADLA